MSRKALEIEHLSPYSGSVRETGWRASVLRTVKDIYWKALEREHFFYRNP